MKKRYRGVIFLLLFYPLLLSANYVHWQGDYNKALQQAHRENKPLLVLVIKRDVPLCGEIIKKVFMNQPYVKQINRDMIAVIVTYEWRVSYPIELFYTTSFPSLFLVNSTDETFLSSPLYEQNISVESLKLLNHLFFMPL